MNLEQIAFPLGLEKYIIYNRCINIVKIDSKFSALNSFLSIELYEQPFFYFVSWRGEEKREERHRLRGDSPRSESFES